MNPARTLARIPAKLLLAFTCVATLAAHCALAQTQAEASKPANACQASSGSFATKVFKLTNIKQDAQDANVGITLETALRNLLCPADTIYFLAGQSAIVVQAAPEQLALAEKLITDLDRPKKAYRLTYTITELDGGKTIGTQHLSMIVVTGQHTHLTAGEKVPVATGSYATDNNTSQTQFTYLDVGMNFNSVIDEVANGVRLQSKVEQSSLGQPTTIAGVQEPVVHQAVVEGTSFLSLGKPVMLGSVDLPNSTRHFDIAVVLDEVK